MSESKVVEAVGKGRLHGDLLRAFQPKDGSVRAEIAKVRVQKVRDGVVYETIIVEVPRGVIGNECPAIKAPHGVNR